MQWHKAGPQGRITAPAMTGYLGTVPGGEIRSPDYAAHDRQAFLVQFEPDRDALGVHFHPVDQFQVFCAGSALFAGHEVGPATVHYADRFSPYGPLLTGPDGVAFLTLRSESSAGAHYMPEAREALAEALHADERPAADRRNLTFEPAAIPSSPGWVDRVVEVDGLRVAEVRLDAKAMSDTTGVGGDGAFAVVLEGEACDDAGDVAGLGSVAWLDPGETASVVAGGRGALVALLQLPRRPAGAIRP